MCGVVGYLGSEREFGHLAKQIQQFEYRGRDSNGFFAVRARPKHEGEEGKTIYIRKVGKASEWLNQSVYNHILLEKVVALIGHTRWATHGGVTVENAHPHLAMDKSFGLVHNGTVVNVDELRGMLHAKGIEFLSQTDTEVIVRLVENLMLEHDYPLLDACVYAFKMLEGSNAIVIVGKDPHEITPENPEPDYQLIAIKKGSPLLIGRIHHDDESMGNDFIVGSDILAFIEYTDDGYILKEEEAIHVFRNGDGNLHANVASIKDSSTWEEIPFEQMSVGSTEAELGEHTSYMSKEIFDQPDTIMNAAAYSEIELAPITEMISDPEGVLAIMGCGTSYRAAQIFERDLRKIAGVNSYAVNGNDSRQYMKVLAEKGKVIGLSQSGESKDLIAPLRILKEHGTRIAALVNREMSTLTQIADVNLPLNAGIEKSVASTKAYTAKVTLSYLISKTIAGEYEDAKKNLLEVSNAMRDQLADGSFHEAITEVAKKLIESGQTQVMGLDHDQSVALEASLKLQEIGYIHALPDNALELKHGPLALIDPGKTIFFFIMPKDIERRKEIMNSIEISKARGAHVVAIDSENDVKFDTFIKLPYVNEEVAHILNILPFQLLAMKIAELEGRNPDEPDFLAKSVTV